MEKPVRKHFILTVCLMVFTGILLLFQRDVNVSDEIGVALELPDKVGEYAGSNRLFCQNEQCGEMYSESDVDKAFVCKSCGTDLDYLSPGEKREYPDDTIVVKKEYVSAVGETIIVSVVTSGKEQKSIHRPQQCLPAHGHVIESAKVINVKLKDGQSIDVMLLDTTRNWQELGGRNKRAHAGFAYWFVSAGRETPYHLQRLLWLSSDRVFKNKASRWSYVSVMSEREEGSGRHERMIADFIAELYPLIVRKTEKLKADS